MWTVSDGIPARIWPATPIASLIGIAKPLPPGPIRKFTDAAVVTPTTWPAPLTTGPPESPARTGAANSMSPVNSSEVPVSASSALTVRPKPVTVPTSRVNGASVPMALPSATTGSPGTQCVRVADGRGRQTAGAVQLKNRDVASAVVADQGRRDRTGHRPFR